MKSPMPEYTVSLLIWILPIIAMAAFFYVKRLLTPEKLFALTITIILLAAVGIILDLFFAAAFFTFPNKSMVCGFTIRNIPVEEFVFYVTGFWFIAFLYVFCDEWYLKRYNPPDEQYARFRKRIKWMTIVNWRGVAYASIVIGAGIVLKRLLNPVSPLIPGYFIFLAVGAYVPYILFYRITRLFVNWRALLGTVLVTVLLSVVWEVTLALPRGYWGYHPEPMVGVFIGVWHNLPIETVTVWIFSSLVILVYEYIKIRFFTENPSVPGHRLFLALGREWRKFK
jgi:hypothetical protein